MSWYRKITCFVMGLENECCYRWWAGAVMIPLSAVAIILMIPFALVLLVGLVAACCIYGIAAAMDWVKGKIVSAIRRSMWKRDGGARGAVAAAALAFTSAAFAAAPADGLLPGMHELPSSPTASKNCKMVMRNSASDPLAVGEVTNGPQIVSSRYADGIGTIYFDAVNAYSTNSSAFVLQVEVSTDSRDDMTAEERASVRWRKVPVRMYRCEGTRMTGTVDSDSVRLDVSGAASADRFYRVVAAVNRHEPCRFRIRRVAKLDGCGADDWRGFILVDNVIASWPPNRIGVAAVAE